MSVTDAAERIAGIAARLGAGKPAWLVAIRPEEAAYLLAVAEAATEVLKVWGEVPGFAGAFSVQRLERALAGDGPEDGGE